MRLYLIIDRLRFFMQVGHETTFASIEYQYLKNIEIFKYLNIKIFKKKCFWLQNFCKYKCWIRYLCMIEI